MDKSLITSLLLIATNLVAMAQTHTMPGSNVVPTGASLTIQSGGSIAAAAGSTITGFGNPLQWDGGATNLVAATGRTSLALVIGTNVEAWNAKLDAISSATATTGTILQGNGTNFVASTAAWPTTNTAGYTVRGDGTNYAAYPTQLSNSSTTLQSPTTADVYLTGSNIVVAPGDFKAKGQYRCLFDVTKSAGTGAIVLTLRVGTAGTTADAAILTFTFGAGTAVADTGIFEVIATWRSVGSGTSAVIAASCRAEHNLATTGLISNAATFIIVPPASSGFASNTATNIGISFNGSTAFAGNIQSVQAILEQ